MTGQRLPFSCAVLGLLALGWACRAGFGSAPEVAKEPRQVYYLTTQAQVAGQERPPEYYQTHGVVPIVLLEGNGANLYAPGFDWTKHVSAVRQRVRGPLYVALWADHAARDEKPGGSTLFPWEDDAGWDVILANLRALRAACERHRVAGVVFDGEIYTTTPENNGGWMGEGAWPAGPSAKVRGRQVREALGGLSLGQYVLVADARRFSGWRDFWGAAYRKRDLLLDEAGYLDVDPATAFEQLGVVNLPGRTLRGGQFRGDVPQGSFWVYPWEPVADLSPFSGRWR